MKTKMNNLMNGGAGNWADDANGRDALYRCSDIIHY